MCSFDTVEIGGDAIEFALYIFKPKSGQVLSSFADVFIANGEAAGHVSLCCRMAQEQVLYAVETDRGLVLK